MHPKQVKDFMGVKTVYEDWMGGNLNDALFYPGIIIGFNDCDSDEPLPDSEVIEFRTNATETITFNNISIKELTLENMKSMVAYGEKAKIQNKLDIVFEKLGLSFGFNEDGSFYGLQMWQNK